jgi:hypothetical protein
MYGVHNVVRFIYIVTSNIIRIARYVLYLELYRPCVVMMWIVVGPVFISAELSCVWRVYYP